MPKILSDEAIPPDTRTTLIGIKVKIHEKTRERRSGSADFREASNFLFLPLFSQPPENPKWQWLYDSLLCLSFRAWTWTPGAEWMGADLACSRGGGAQPPPPPPEGVFRPPPPGGQSLSQKYPKNKQKIALKRSIFHKFSVASPRSSATFFLKICSKTPKFRQNFVFLSFSSKIFQNFVFVEKFQNFSNFLGKFGFSKLVFDK